MTALTAIDRAFAAQDVTGPEWAEPLRSQGRAAFAASGVPHRRMEDWKYTDLRGRMPEAWAPAPRASVVLAPALPFTSPEAACAVFVDGHLRPELSALSRLPEGVEIVDLAAADSLPGWAETAAGDGLVALNAALFAGGVAVRVAAGFRVERPLYLAFNANGTGQAAHSRHVVVLEDGASLTVLESHAGGSGARLANIVVAVRLGAGASLAHVRLQDDGADAFHVQKMSAELAPGAVMRSYLLTAGAALSRMEVHVRLQDRARAEIAGALLLSDGQHADTTLRIAHEGVAAESRQVFRSVLDGASRGVVQGKVVVRPGAQQTDAHQLLRALLLSPQAEADAKPELEIFADDVKCGHGATTGELDEDALFYLRARGVPEAEARAVLIEAFLAESLEDAPQGSVRDALSGVVARYLTARRTP